MLEETPNQVLFKIVLLMMEKISWYLQQQQWKESLHSKQSKPKIQENWSPSRENILFSPSTWSYRICF